MPYRREVRKKIGRRGLLLMLFGVTWFLYGVQITHNQRDRFSSTGPAPDPILVFMDHPAWGWMWVAVGVFATGAGFFRNRRPFLGNDEMGYRLAIIPPVLWCLFYLFSWAAHLLSNGEFGQAGSSYGLTLFSLITGIILTISGWPEELVHSKEEEKQARARHRERKRRGTL